MPGLDHGDVSEYGSSVMRVFRSAAVYGVTALWDGQRRHAEADAVGPTPLLSMSLLDDHDLNVQVATAAASSSRQGSSANARWVALAMRRI